MNPRPCDADTAISRLLSIVGADAPYILGTGGMNPGALAGDHRAADLPWSPGSYRDKRGVIVNALGSDCAGAGLWARMLPRHRPGFNRGCSIPMLDVEDDINTNSAIGDALSVRPDLFQLVPKGDPIEQGDVLAYPTITLYDASGKPLRNADGEIMKWIGHWQTVLDPSDVLVGQPFTPVQVIQCFGPNGRRPAVMVSDAHACDMHDHTWPNEEHRTRVLRFVA